MNSWLESTKPKVKKVHYPVPVGDWVTLPESNVTTEMWKFTPSKINIEPENDGLEDDFPLPKVYSQVPC